MHLLYKDRSFLKNQKNGFSMIEVLTVTAILAVLMIIAITQLPKQLEKAKDSRRKSDLQKVKIAFENWHNDEGCYPPDTILDNCGGTELEPYLKIIPCDPGTEQSYIYYPEEAPTEPDCPQNYRVWADLYKTDDPQSVELNCGDIYGCGLYSIESIRTGLGLEAIEYNYGVSEGVPVSAGGINTNLTEGYCCQGAGTSCDSWTGGTALCVVGPFEDADECNYLTDCEEVKFP